MLRSFERIITVQIIRTNLYGSSTSSQLHTVQSHNSALEFYVFSRV